MPTQTLTVGCDELSTVSIRASKKQRDGLVQTLPLMEVNERVNGKGKPSRDGSSVWLQSVEVQEHSGATDNPTGYAEYDLAVLSTDQSFQFTPAFSGAPVLISHVEENVHHGSDRIFDLAKKRTENVIRAMMRNAHKQWCRGGVAGFTSWATLDGVNNSDGYLEEDAHGSQGNTVGGLSKATYAGVPGMNNWSYNFSSAVGSNGRAGILYLMSNMEEFAGGTNQGECAMLATQAFAVNAARCMEPYMTYAPADSAKGVEMGGPKVLINGYPVRATSHLQTSGTPVSLMIVPLKDIYPMWMVSEYDGYFGFDPFRQHSGSYRVKVAFVDCNGQLWVESFGGAAIGINGEVF